MVGNIAGSLAVHERAGSRARVRSGQLLPGIDGRSWWTRRCRELIAAYVADLGGVDNVSAAERAICRRAATLQIELERLEFKFAMLPDDVAASAADIDLYQRTAGGWRRLLETVGIRRRPRDVGELTLDDILAEDAAEDADDAEA